jgi:ADP-dependent NAD(P)H-hydrate dehydratase
VSRTGSSAKLITAELLRRWPLPTLGKDADKVSRGDVLVVAGSLQLAGAATLAGEAALRVGAGRVQLATARAAASAVSSAFPEARVIGLAQTRSGEISGTAAQSLKRELAACKALLVGPGMNDHATARALLEQALRRKHGFTAVLDAGALRLFRNRRPLPGRHLEGVIATPHAGEMADLWGCDADDVHAAPLELAREAARALRVTLVLKGTETFIVDPDGTAFRNVAGNSGLATAGSGDVLSGLIAGLAARGATPAQAAVWGVYAHAKAGDALKQRIGPLGYLARELAAEVPAILGRLEAR